MSKDCLPHNVSSQFLRSAFPLYYFDTLTHFGNYIGHALEKKGIFPYCVISIVARPNTGKTHIAMGISNSLSPEGTIIESTQKHKKRPVWTVRQDRDNYVVNIDMKQQFHGRNRQMDSKPSSPWMPSFKKNNCVIIEHTPMEHLEKTDLIIHIDNGATTIIRNYANPNSEVGQFLHKESQKFDYKKVPLRS